MVRAHRQRNGQGNMASTKPTPQGTIYYFHIWRSGVFGECSRFVLKEEMECLHYLTAKVVGSHENSQGHSAAH